MGIFYAHSLLYKGFIMSTSQNFYTQQQKVRMASSGHRGSIEHIKVAHKIRELKFKDLLCSGKYLAIEPSPKPF